MHPQPRRPDKQKSLELIRRLKKRATLTRQTLNSLQRVLPGYLSLSQRGYRCLQLYCLALDELEQEVSAFPEQPRYWV